MNPRIFTSTKSSTRHFSWSCRSENVNYTVRFVGELLHENHSQMLLLYLYRTNVLYVSLVSCRYGKLRYHYTNVLLFIFTIAYVITKRVSSGLHNRREHKTGLDTPISLRVRMDQSVFDSGY